MSKNSIRKLIIGCAGIAFTFSLISHAAHSSTTIQKEIAPGITLHILKGDITMLNKVDVIVNAANARLLGGAVSASLPLQRSSVCGYHVV